MRRVFFNSRSLCRSFHSLGSGKRVSIPIAKPFLQHGGGCTCGFCSFVPEPPTTNTDDDDHAEPAKKFADENAALKLEIELMKQQLQELDPTTSHTNQSVDTDIEGLLENNRRWVKEEKEKDPTFFDRLGVVQKPKFLYIGCSDSRVSANSIMGLGPGMLYVHRNVANQVIGNDLNVLSTIEYAVEVLDVKHIIVAGHYGCGAIRAAMTSGVDMGLLENWLRSLRDIYRHHHQVLDAIEDEEERHRKFTEVAVVEQCLNLYKTGIVQRRRKETHRALRGTGIEAYPRIHAMVYDPGVGLLKNLPIDFDTTLHRFKHIYDLY